LETHIALCEKYVESEADIPPTPLIEQFVQRLLARYPELDEGVDTAWAAAPLLGEAAGPYICLPITPSYAEEASAFVADVANELGLVCYDPQQDCLRA